jgi:hypothetical protein
VNELLYVISNSEALVMVEIAGEEKLPASIFF